MKPTINEIALDSRTRYTGTKTLLALPMTRGEYNDYRGWTPPEGEDQSTPGYLVEYLNGGSPNDERHEGYISWSPADVFDATYSVVVAPPEETWQSRLMAEGNELDQRLRKLREFQHSSNHDVLPLPDRELLAAQERYMTKYLDILAQRRMRMIAAEPRDWPDHYVENNAVAAAIEPDFVGTSVDEIVAAEVAALDSTDPEA